MYQFVQAHAKEIHDELQEFPAYAVQVPDDRTHRTHRTQVYLDAAGTHTTHF
jgi:hypothetical protein